MNERRAVCRTSWCMKIIFLLPILYFGVVIYTYAQTAAQIEQLRSRQENIGMIITQNSSKINEIERRVNSLEELKVEHRLTLLENTSETNFRLNVGIMGAVILQLIERIISRVRISKRS